MRQTDPVTSADSVREAPTGELSTGTLLLITVLLTVASAITVRPLGLSGAGLYGLILLIGSAVLVGLRVVDLERWGPQARFVSMLIAAVVVGLFYGFDVSSWAVSFAYVLTFAAGVRLPRNQSYVVAGLTTACALVSTAASGAIANGWPAWASLTVFLPVFMGMSRRAAARQLTAAQDLVAQTERTRAAERQASALEERTRLARELHDVLAHSLTGVGLQLDLADAQLEAGQVDKARSAVVKARSLTNEGVDEARAVITALREDSTTLATALARVVQDPEQLTIGPFTAEPTAAVRHALLRVTQESLTNARRHAPASPAHVDLRQDPECWQLTITNGPSLTSGITGSGMGVVGMQERVAALGGTAQIGRTDDDGWQVLVRIPLGDRA